MNAIDEVVADWKESMRLECKKVVNKTWVEVVEGRHFDGEVVELEAGDKLAAY